MDSPTGSARYPPLPDTDALRLPANRFTEFKESGNGHPFTLGDMAVSPLRVAGVGGQAASGVPECSSGGSFLPPLGGLLMPVIEE